MRVAIPHWQGRVSPVFDVATDLLLVDVEQSVESHREYRLLTNSDPLGRAKEVAGLGPDVVICGAVSMVLETALINAGIKVFGFVCGKVEDIMGAFISGGLTDSQFLMPGTCSKRRRAGFQAKRRDRHHSCDDESI